MTGPEHYRHTEHLLNQLRTVCCSHAGTSLIAEAQEHATLAVAAATALAGSVRDVTVWLETAYELDHECEGDL